jgi:hypothetical protein
VLDGLDLADPHREVVRVGEDAAKELGAFGEVGGEFGEQLEKLGIAGDETHESDLSRRCRASATSKKIRAEYYLTREAWRANEQ